MFIYGCQRLVYNLNIKNFKFYWKSFPSKKDFKNNGIYFFLLSSITAHSLLLLLTFGGNLGAELVRGEW